MYNLIDMHCHLLPQVDDGASNIRTALEMLLMEEMDGVSDVILTPHHRVGMFETSRERINASFLKLKSEAEKKDIRVRLHLGCEYHSSSSMKDDFLSGRWMTLADSAYVLTEFSGMERYSVIKQRIDELQNAGFIPVIAHAERIESLCQMPSRFEELVSDGVRIQVTACTLLGEDGYGSARFCRKLLKDGFVHFIATDAHDLKNRMPDLRECADFVIRKYGASLAREIFVTNPEKILKRIR